MTRILLVLALLVGAHAVLLPAQAPLDRDVERWVKRTLDRMSLDEKIGQMLVPGFEGTYLATDSDGFALLARYVKEQRVGGFIVFGGSQPVPGVLLNQTYGAITLGQPYAAAATLNRLQQLSAVPLLTSADFEWGVGMRIHGGTTFPRAMAFGATGDTRLAEEAGRVTALEARAMGVHLNFAPVADVNNNPRNPVINTRSFGETPESVSGMVASYVRGLQDHGMLATLKHFPGHGDTAVDTHLGLALIEHPKERLQRVELPPFEAGIRAGAAAVMTSHIALPGLEPAPKTPATWSANVATALLRDEMRFGGLVVTDSMKMAGITELAREGEAAVRAVKAGHDMLLDLPDPAAAMEAIREAVKAGEITEARITASAERVLRAKARIGLHRQKVVDLGALGDRIGGRANREVARLVSERSITLLKDERNAVPLALPSSASVLHLSILDYPGGWAIAAPSRTFSPELRKRWANVTAVELSDRSTPSEIDLVQALASRHDAIVATVVVRAASASGRMDLSAPLQRLLADLARRTKSRGAPFVTVFFGNPYAAMFIPELPAVMLTYDYYDQAELSAVRALVGEAPVRGKLPIALPGLFPIGHGLVRDVRGTSQ